MKSYYITTHPGTEKHEVHEVGCKRLPIERRYIGEFKDSNEALMHIKYTHAEAKNCAHCDGSNMPFAICL